MNRAEIGSNNRIANNDLHENADNNALQSTTTVNVADISTQRLTVKIANLNDAEIGTRHGGQAE